MSTPDKYKFYAAELGAEIPELDLHGIYPDQAVEKLDMFLYDMYQSGKEVGRIIYGGGTGRLAEFVLNQLKKHPLVKTVKKEFGHCLVLIKK